MMKHKKIAIVAADSDWAIGKDNDLLYRLPEDMKFFRETTKGAIVIYGYNTLLSFPGAKPLPGRTNIVVCPDTVDRDGILTAHDLSEIDTLLASIPDNRPVFICGGASIYAQLIDTCDEAYVTKVAASTPGATAFFPDLDARDGWTCYEEGAETETSTGYKIKFTKYKRTV